MRIVSDILIRHLEEAANNGPHKDVQGRSESDGEATSEMMRYVPELTSPT